MKPYLRQQVLSLIHLKDGNFKPCHLKYIFSMSCMRRLFIIILVPWISVKNQTNKNDFAPKSANSKRLKTEIQTPKWQV